MPYETIWEEEGVYQRYSGRLSKGDREFAANDVLGDSRFDSLKYWLVDSLAIDEYLLDERDAVIAAAFDIGAQHYNSDILMVFVATNTDHRRNIAKYIEVLQSQCCWKAKLFDDMQSARQWISDTLKADLPISES